MSRKPESISDQPRGGPCFARAVLTALKENPALSAVSVDRKQEKVSIAGLEEAKLKEVQGRISKTLEAADRTRELSQCTLLEGHGNCRTCGKPLPEEDHRKITIRYDGDRTTFARVTCPTAQRFWRWRDLPLPKIVPREVEVPKDAKEAEEWKAQLVAAIICGVLGITAWLLENNHVSFAHSIYLAAYVAGSWYTLHEVWERLQEREIDVHFLMLAVAAGSAAIGAWGEGTMLLFLFSFSGALEHFALGRTQKEIRSLFREAPKVATVIDSSGGEHEVDVARLETGMRLLLKPGAQFPVDAEIVSGQTAADESNLTGEAVPVEKKVGDRVLSGTMNLWGAVQAVVIHPARESALQKIIHLIQQAQQRKAPSQRFTDTFSTYYTYAALLGSLGMFFVWWKLMGVSAFTSINGSPSAFYRTMTLLVVASPCALVLSIPSAVLAAIACGARHGILFRGGAAVEKLAGVSVVALDKTGTLTTGELRVETVESFPPGREKEVASLVYSMEKLSTHPLARAITRYGKQSGLAEIQLHGFESITGSGLKATFGNQPCFLGRKEWVKAQSGLDVSGHGGEHQLGISEIWVAHGDLLGRLILRDDIRPQAAGVLTQLKERNLKPVVLTGDTAEAAHHLKEQLPVADVRAGLKPEDKVQAIRDLSDAGERVAMIGDGVNDAPSLATAHIGVAMGARGSDAALEQADVVLMHDRLENFLAAFHLSRRARSVIRQNLVISLGTVVVLVSLAIAGKVPLTLGVLGHEGSTVIVVMNSLRLLFKSR